MTYFYTQNLPVSRTCQIGRKIKFHCLVKPNLNLSFYSLKQCITLHKNSGGAGAKTGGGLEPLSPIASAATGGISWAICKSASCSRQITTPAPHHSVFYRPDALPAAQPTVSKHWRHWLLLSCPITQWKWLLLTLIPLAFLLPPSCQSPVVLITGKSQQNRTVGSRILTSFNSNNSLNSSFSPTHPSDMFILILSNFSSGFFHSAWKFYQRVIFCEIKLAANNN